MVMYTHNHALTESVAVLAGMRPDEGLVNDLNEMAKNGTIDKCKNVGEVYEQWLLFKLRKLQKVVGENIITEEEDV